MSKPYESAFRVGDSVRVAARSALERFKQDWKFHHPITDEQLTHADLSARVAAVSFYHGGDPLYELEGLPGVWHEENLAKATEQG